MNRYADNLSNQILEVVKANCVPYYRVYREKRAGAKFIDGYSFKLYGCKLSASKIRTILHKAGIDTSLLNVEYIPSRWLYMSGASIVITYK